MPHLVLLLLKPWADLISRDEPTTLRQLIAALDKAVTGLAVAFSLYALSLEWLNIGQILDRITESQEIPSLTDRSELLTILSVVVVLKLVGGKAIVKLKFLVQPLIEYLQNERREEFIAEGRQRQAASTQAWLEEQERAGRITIHEKLEVPVFDSKERSNGHSAEGNDD